MTLSHFQEIVQMALDLDDSQAELIQRNWPPTQEELRRILREWKQVTGSQVPGLQLLAACTEIYQHRPTDLAEAEGREILYHPVTGKPLTENDGLYGQSWEMLAFLHWATQHGLMWTDEVTIIREVTAAKGQVDNLPPDRFFCKTMLPRTPNGGAIDWSDLGLAKAKSFVTTGMVTPDTVLYDDAPILFGNNNDLHSLLCKIPALRDSSARNHLLRGMPARPAGAIRRSSAPSNDLYNIVEAVEGWGQLASGKIATNVLIDNALRLTQGTALGTQLLALKK